jgi:endonuclease IV
MYPCRKFHSKAYMYTYIMNKGVRQFCRYLGTKLLCLHLGKKGTKFQTRVRKNIAEVLNYIYEVLNYISEVLATCQT